MQSQNMHFNTSGAPFHNSYVRSRSQPVEQLAQWVVVVIACNGVMHSLARVAQDPRNLGETRHEAERVVCDGANDWLHGLLALQAKGADRADAPQLYYRDKAIFKTGRSNPLLCRGFGGEGHLQRCKASMCSQVSLGPSVTERESHAGQTAPLSLPSSPPHTSSSRS